MNLLIQHDIINEATLCLQGMSLREIAIIIGKSKSTIHLDLTKKLIKFNRHLAYDVEKELQQHFKNKHINGGMATKNKYIISKEVKQ